MQALKFTTETQTEKREVMSLCHLNEKVIALEISEVARKLFKLNRELFNAINNSTKIIDGRIYREEVTRIKADKNRCFVKLFDKYEHKDVEIITLSFSNNQLARRQSIILKTGERVDFNPTHVGRVSNIGGMPQPLDHQNLTYDDVKNSTTVCEIAELQLFQQDGVKTYLLKDYLNDSPGIDKVSYRIEILAKTGFEEYVDYVLSEMKKTLSFLTLYENSLEASTNYDPVKLEFKKVFRDSIFNRLGITNQLETKMDLGTGIIKNSQFGKAGMNFYNASLLLGEQIEKSVYGDVVKALLPTSKTNPENISSVIKSFQKLYSRIVKTYKSLNKDSKSDYFIPKIHSKNNTIKRFISSRTEVFDIDRHVLGYNVFSETQKGLTNFTATTFRRRMAAERLLYGDATKAADESNFLTKTEMEKFTSTANQLTFATPTSLVMDDKQITCTRGMNNIPVKDVRLFRLAKAARASQVKKTNLPAQLSNNGLTNNIMSEYNVTVGPPKNTIFERPVNQIIDPLVDSRLYVGENSFFVTDNPSSIYRKYDRLLAKDNQKILGILSDVIPANFLTKDGAINSIKDLQVSNKKSTIRGLISENKINLDEIPPQIKAMMSTSYQHNPLIDPLKNAESSAIIKETQMNLFVIEAQTGFELDSNGFADLNRPIIQNMSNAVLNGQPTLARAQNYEVAELGVLKDSFLPTIYNNLVYIQG